MLPYRVTSGKQTAIVVVLGLGVMLRGAGVVAGQLRWPIQSGAIYTVIGLQRQVLHDHRDRWMGRTVLVRGIVTGFLPPERDQPLVQDQMHLVLLDVGRRQGLLGDLPLTRGPEHPVLHRLRLLPIIGPLLPSPQALTWGEPAVYRVTLHLRPGTSCDLCFTAEILDAA